MAIGYGGEQEGEVLKVGNVQKQPVPDLTNVLRGTKAQTKAEQNNSKSAPENKLTSN